MSSTKDEIDKFIQDIKSRGDSWLLSRRRKNIVTLTELGLDQEEIFEIIIENLSWTDYVQGPELDDHEPSIPGNIWIFGLNIENNELPAIRQQRLIDSNNIAKILNNQTNLIQTLKKRNFKYISNL